MLRPTARTLILDPDTEIIPRGATAALVVTLGRSSAEAANVPGGCGATNQRSGAVSPV